MNTQIYESALELSDELLQKDLGAFFGSINATLNHILVGDLLWFSRFSRLTSRYKSAIHISKLAQPTELNEILFENTQELWACRKKWIILSISDPILAINLIPVSRVIL